ncbi:MAG: hypothetical protein ACOCV1_04770 [Bacillota bacterium]
MKVLEIFSWDNGFNSEKMVASKEKRIVFPSVIVKRNKGKKIDFKLNGQNFNKDKMMVKIGNNEYSVGTNAVNNARNSYRKNYDLTKFKKESEKIKLMSGVSALFPNENEIIIKNLYISHSLQSYNKYKNEIINEFQNKTFEYEIPTARNGVKRVVLKIENVRVFPQGLAAYFDEILDFEGGFNEESLLVEKNHKDMLIPSNKRYFLIDIGDNTTDCFIGEGQEIIRNSIFSPGIGMKDVFDYVKNQFDIKLSVLDLERVIIDSFQNNKDRITIRSEYQKIDITDIVKESFEVIAEEIINEIKSEWNRESGSEELAITCGGGAYFLGDYIDSLYKNMDIKHILINDPQFSNAKGIYKIGVLNNSN